MADEDLSQLKIDKAKAAFQPRRKKQFLYPSLILAGAACSSYSSSSAFLPPPCRSGRPPSPRSIPRSAFIVLNASGYVVPQRKSALASKVTGRLVWLGVEEGSRVKKDQVVARLEGQDVAAAQDQAAAARRRQP